MNLLPLEQYQPKSAVSSTSVHSFDGSPISVFNTEVGTSSALSANYNNFETSVELPPADPNLIDQFFTNNPQFENFHFDQDLLKDLFPEDNLFQTEDQTQSSMTIIENHEEPTLQNTSLCEQEHFQPQPMDSTSINTHRSSISSVSNFSDVVDHEETVVSRSNTTSSGAGGKFARFGNKKVVKYSNEYHERRLKNNVAVKNSRLKAKEKQKSTESQMSKLIEENQSLNERVELLMKELQVLRSLYKELKSDQTNGRAQTRQK